MGRNTGKGVDKTISRQWASNRWVAKVDNFVILIN